MRKHIITVLTGILMAFILIIFSKSFTELHTAEWEYRLNMLPLFILICVAAIYAEILIVYILFKLFYMDKITLNVFLNNILEKYVVLSLIGFVINFALKGITDNKIILSISSFSITGVECFIIYDYLKKIDSSGRKKYIILAIIVIKSILF